MRSRIRRVIVWSFLVFTTVIAGGAWYAYTYVTDGTTLANLIKEQTPRFMPGCETVVQRAKLRPFAGELTLDQVFLRERFKDRSGISPMLLRSPWLKILFDPWAMFEGRLSTREVIVAQPTLRIRRRADGGWNLVGLFADPWPLAPPKATPRIVINHGTVEIDDDTLGDSAPAIVLRDVTLTIAAGTVSGGPVAFEGSANGDMFESLRIKGTFDRKTKKIALEGDLLGLAINRVLRDRLPAEYRSRFDEAGVSGEADLAFQSVEFDPGVESPLSYRVAADFRSGIVAHALLPFPLNDVSASMTLENGKLILERFEGVNGQTTAAAHGTMELVEFEKSVFDLTVEARYLDLDDRIKRVTPAKFLKLWDEYRPGGRVSAEARILRSAVGAPLEWGIGAVCHDVSLEYHEFRYPVEHVSGRMSFNPKHIDINLETLIGGKPATARGGIDNPGRNAVVKITFEAESLPVDKKLKDALPKDVRDVVESFHPAGAVRGTAVLVRLPPPTPNDNPKGIVTIDSTLDLNPGCSMLWDGLKYPISNMTGRLELHPTSWEFKNMRGSNGQATISGAGKVERMAAKRYKVHIDLESRNLPFDQQLRDALPMAWQRSWRTINPTGASDVIARIDVEPGKPDHYHLEILPRPESNIRLAFEREEIPGVDRGGLLEMRMEDVTGRFVHDDGTVRMYDGGFFFRGAPVKFKEGVVRVQDDGRFSIGVTDLQVSDLRLDQGVRKLMPDVMSQFARRLDDRTLRFRANLGLGWSGKPDEPAWCRWDNGLLIFDDNVIQAGVPLEHMQGQVENLEGAFDGRNLTVKGNVNLDHVSVLGQAISRVTSPLEVGGGSARISDIRGKLWGGDLTGSVVIGLETTPKYTLDFLIRDADLESYAKTLRGRQTFRGLVNGGIRLTGLGADLHDLQGSGEAHIRQGELGKLPFYLRLVNYLKLSQSAKSAFDSADVGFTIRNGLTIFDSIKVLGSSLSLQGAGTLDLQGDLDLRLHVLLGRDLFHLPILSDAFREASGKFFMVRVLGTLESPNFKPDPLPQAGDLMRSLGNRRRIDGGRK